MARMVNWKREYEEEIRQEEGCFKSLEAVTSELCCPWEREVMRSAEEWLVFEGDWGGQIYLTVPRKLIGKNSQVKFLLRLLDRSAWGDNGGGSSMYYYRPADDKQFAFMGVCGGMGGGMLTDEVWIHEDFLNSKRRDWLGMAKRILDINNGNEK